MLIMGAIGAPYGIHGWLRVRSFTAPVDNLARYAPWWLSIDGAWRPRPPAQVRVHGQGLVATFPGVTDRNQAAVLVGAGIGVPRHVLPPPADDEYYWRDLEGLTVVDQHGDTLGRVQGLMDIGVHTVLEIEGPRGEVLVPFVARHVTRVDLAAGRLDVDWEEPA